MIQAMSSNSFNEMLPHLAVNYGQNPRPCRPSGLPRSPQFIPYSRTPHLLSCVFRASFLPIFDTLFQLPLDKFVKTSSAERTRLLHWMMRMRSFKAMPRWQQKNGYVF